MTKSSAEFLVSSHFHFGFIISPPPAFGDVLLLGSFGTEVSAKRHQLQVSPLSGLAALQETRARGSHRNGGTGGSGWDPSFLVTLSCPPL
jgi:hypothetical protein